MSNPTWDPTGDVREALRRIVADFGTPALSNPQVMENGLDDQLPNGTEKQKSILVGASKAGVPASLQEHVARGMDPDHAVQLIASRLAEMAGFEATACGWVTSEFARALGYQISDAATQAIAPPAGSPFSAKSDETLLLPYQSTRPPGIPPDYGPPVSERSPPGVPPPASGIGRAMGGAPGGAHRKSVAVIVAVVVICLIGVVVAHQFWPSTPGHPTPLSTTSKPTVPPASSPLDLTNNPPVFLTNNGSCSPVTGRFTTVNATEEILCKVTNTNASESFVVYAQFQDKYYEQTYYQTLLTLNGMTAGQGGDCSTINLPSDGPPRYCETGYSGHYSGNVFISAGTTSFPLGSGYTVSGTCGNNPSSVGVVGFSDDTNHVVAIAATCDDSNNQVEGIVQDFHNNRLNIGSTVTG